VAIDRRTSTPLYVQLRHELAIPLWKAGQTVAPATAKE
jgi:hypothetical protein